MLMCPTSPPHPVDASQSPALSSDQPTQPARRFHATAPRTPEFLLHEQPPPPPNKPHEFGEAANTKKPIVANKPKFKLLQRPKIPRGHKPPLSSVISPTILQRPCDDSEKDQPQAQAEKHFYQGAEKRFEYGTKTSNRQRTNYPGWLAQAPGASAPNLLGHTSSDVCSGAGIRTPSEESSSSSLIVTSYQVNVGTDIHHNTSSANGTSVSTSCSLRRQSNTDQHPWAPSVSGTSSVLTSISSIDPEQSRKAQHSDNVRSLRERERLYEEAKRRIWTSAQKKDAQNACGDAGNGATFASTGMSDELSGLQHKRVPSVSSSSGVWYDGVPNNCQGLDGRQPFGTSSMSNIAPPMYGYDICSEDRHQPSTNMPQYSSGMARFQRIEEAEMRRPLSWGGSGKFFTGAPLPVPSAFSSYSQNSSSLPMIIGPDNGNYYYYPSSPSLSRDTRGPDFCEERATEEPRDHDSSVSRMPEGRSTTTSASLAPQPLRVEPWELVPVDPTHGATDHKGGTCDAVYNQDNGPPPLDNDFLFPPLGRCAENQRSAG